MSAECGAAGIPSGYKKTGVGMIPEDWEVKRLEEIADVIDPHPSHRAPPEVTNGIPFVGIGDLNDNGDIIGNKIRTVDQSVFDEHQKRYDLEEELIGLGRVASIGKVVKIKFTGNKYTISPTLGIIRGTKVKRDYLLYALKNKTTTDQFNKIMSGSTRSSVGMIVLRKLEIILPSKEDEQEAIAEALSDADALIESLEQLIAKKRQIKQGAMQELLIGKRRLPGFGEGKGYKQTEIGMIPERWRIKKLDEIADVIDPHPSHRAPPEVINGIPFVGIGDLNENGDIIGNRIRNVDPSVFDEHQKRYDLEDELIGLGRVASIGKVVKIKFVGNRYTISPTLGIIRGTLAKRDYLFYALKSKTTADQFNKIMSGSTRSSVGMIVLRKLDIILPSKEDEQTAIATTLSDMDSEITALEEKLAKACQLKQGMMQELLTGRIRLI
jgi:type I restriction enzyme, S subunit